MLRFVAKAPKGVFFGFDDLVFVHFLSNLDLYLTKSDTKAMRMKHGFFKRHEEIESIERCSYEEDVSCFACIRTISCSG